MHERNSDIWIISLYRSAQQQNKAFSPSNTHSQMFGVSKLWEHFGRSQRRLNSVQTLCISISVPLRVGFLK